MEFAVDRSVVVNELQLQSICIHEGLAKLKVAAFAKVFDWIEKICLHN